MNIDGIPLTGYLSSAVMMSILFLFLATGRLATRAAVMREQQQSDYWRQAYMNESKAHAETTQQLHQVVRALPLPNTGSAPPDHGERHAP